LHYNKVFILDHILVRPQVHTGFTSLDKVAFPRTIIVSSFKTS